MRARLATAIGAIVFLVLAGTGVSFAYWSTSASTSGSVAVASPSTTNCVSPTRLVNGSFESPNISPNLYSQLAPNLVPGWAVLNDNVIEVWRGQSAIVPPTGAQLAELNGNAFGTLYQDVATVPGQTLRWSVQHRGREGVDGMRVSVNATGGALVQQDQFTDPVGPWVLHTGAYVVPAGQTSTRISLVPVSTANNNVSIGNLIDDVTLGSGPCLQASSVISNVTTGGSSYKVGDVVQYTTTVTNIGGAPATPSTISAVVPANLTYLAGSLIVDGTARTDAAGDDVASYASGTNTVAATIGYGATAAAGGIVSPDQIVTFSFRATIGVGAAGGNLSFAATAGYTDLFAPSWPLSAVSPTLTTAVAPAADVAMSVIASPNATAGTGKVWSFRVTNNGPATAIAASVAVTVPTGLTGTPTVVRSATSAGGATTACTPATGAVRTCAVGDLTSGDSRIITVTGVIPASPTGLFPATAVASTTTYDSNAANNTVVNNAIDVTAPSTPGTPIASATTGTQTTLTWTASTDNVAVTGYRIFRNGVQIGTSATNSYTATGLTAGQPYYFWVQAVDAVPNVSAASGGRGVVTTLGTGRYQINYVLGNLCLGAASIADDAQVQTLACNGASGNQRWLFTTDGTTADGINYLVSPQDGPTREIRVVSNNTANSIKIVADQDGTSRKDWVLLVDWDAATNQAYLAIKSTYSLRCLDVNGSSVTPGVQLQQNDCNASTAQRFRLTAAP